MAFIKLSILALTALALCQPLLAESMAPVVMGKGRIRANISAPAPLTRPARPQTDPYARLYAVPDAISASASPEPVLAWLEGAFASPRPSHKQALTLCFQSFSPRPSLLAVPRGATVTFLNDDPVAHQPFAISELGSFQLKRLLPGQSAQHRFDRLPSTGPSMIPIFCALHPWEKAMVVVMPSAYYCVLSSQGGEVDWKGVPAGPCFLRAWRPGLHGGARALRLKPGQTLDLNLSLQGEQ